MSPSDFTPPSISDMIDAISNGNNAKVKEYIEQGFDIKQKFIHNLGDKTRSPVHASFPLLAITSLNPEALDILIKNGADNPFNRVALEEIADNINPFYHLANLDNRLSSMPHLNVEVHKEKVKELYQVFIKNNLLDSPLAKAYSIQSVLSDVKTEALKELIRDGLPLTSTYGRHEYSLAHEMVKRSCKKEDAELLLKLMMDKGLDISKPDHSGLNVYQLSQKKVMNLYQNPVWADTFKEYLEKNPDKAPALKIESAPLNLPTMKIKV